MLLKMRVPVREIPDNSTAYVYPEEDRNMVPLPSRVALFSLQHFRGQ
jgi:hypothetical protein